MVKIEFLFKGSDGVSIRASDFHFIFRGSNPGLIIALSIIISEILRVLKLIRGCIAHKLQLAKWQIKKMRDQKKWFLYRKCVNLIVKGPTDYQLQLKRIIIALIFIKQEYYLQLVWKLVQAEDFSILLK